MIYIRNKIQFSELANNPMPLDMTSYSISTKFSEKDINTTV